MPSVANDSGNKRITILPGKKHLILCEGKDDESFISCFAGSGFLSRTDFDAIQVSQYYGKDNLRNTMRVLINADGFLQIRSLLVFRDADDNIKSAQDSVKGAFGLVGLPVPQTECQWQDNGTIKTGFLLMPSCSAQPQEGALEDLCWDILAEKHGPLIKEEVEGFIHSLEADAKRSYVHRNKAVLHTYFSATEGLISASVGRAAEAGAFDWTSEKLQPLRDFLISMV